MSSDPPPARAPSPSLPAGLQALHARLGGRPRRTVAVTGASGLIGRALAPLLEAGGHVVRAVTRAEGRALDAAALEGADAVVHLAGAGLAARRWTAARKRELVDSRVALTRSLVKTLGALKAPPRVLLSASAVGVYGDRGDEELTEASAPGLRGETGAAFLAGLCLDWEAAALEARALGVRVALLRTGVVLTRRGGALPRMLPAFKAGLGGPLGRGTQWLAWIGLDDAVGALHHALFDESLAGPVNLVAPEAVTSAGFARALGHALSRPAVLPAPGFALRALFGELADATLLSSQRVRPAALERAGYAFRCPRLEDALTR